MFRREALRRNRLKLSTSAIASRVNYAMIWQVRDRANEIKTPTKSCPAP
ncbi:MAG: hypothetical protein ACYTXE_29470 [Nostoc sp.]